MKKLDRFILRETLSDGPAGTVYRADEILPGDNRRAVALKVLPIVGQGAIAGESDAEKQFFGEIKSLSQLAVHPNIVTIYAMGLTDGYPWLAMEYSAATLAGRIGENPAEPAEVLRVLEHVGRGLLAMHNLKPPLIHQDLKPANILRDPLGNYKITDFSSATAVAANKTQSLATVKYAAPELLSAEFGRVGPPTDLYGLGHIAYEMALGTRQHRIAFPAVFEGNTSKEPPPNKWMMWHVSMGMKAPAIADILRDFPAVLSEVISRLISKPPAERYASAAELLDDLGVLRHEMPGESPLPVSTNSAKQSSNDSTAGRVRSAPPPLPTARPAGTASTSGGSGAGMKLENTAASPTPATAGGARYWVRLRGKVTGPYDLATLQRQLKQGLISRLHQVSTDQATWKQATDVEGLYGPTVV